MVGDGCCRRFGSGNFLEDDRDDASTIGLGTVREAGQSDSAELDGLKQYMAS